jgi:hypothetical protein
MKRRMASRQGGAALLVLLAVLAIGASWFMVSRLDALAASATARNRQHNADVLLRAKLALIGYVAAQAAKDGENNPGSLPCPEDPGNFNSEVGNQGKIGVNCGTTVKVGRFPWLTVGLDKLTDASGEALWYVVSPNWSYNIGTNSSINSNSMGNLTVDGVANAAVALIIAPGPAISVPACGSSAAINQVRSLSGTPDWRNYLECENASNPTDSTFVTTGPAGSFNDQVLVVTAADMLPGIEAAIAHRIEREIVPGLRTVFTSSYWPQFFANATPAVTVSASNPLFPFAAPFANPSTSNYVGSTTAGLLPFNQTVGCTGSDPRCSADVIAFSGTPSPYKASGLGYIQGTPTCSVTGDIYECQGEYHEDNGTPSGTMRVELAVTLSNVFSGLRTSLVDATSNGFASRMGVGARDDVTLGAWQTQAHTYAYTINTNGSVTFTFGATLPNIDVMGWGTYAQFRIWFDKSSLFGDHSLLDSTSTGIGTTGWFVRNEWYRLLYYVVASGHTAAALPTPPTCTVNGSCLRVANVTPDWSQRALLFLAGQSINGSARPSSTLADYLEPTNSTGTYTRLPVRVGKAIPDAQKFNDRVMVISSN